MKFSARISRILIVASLLTLTTGCRYFTNRYYDFRDTFSVGAGVTAENSRTGVIPCSLGAYVEVTDLLHLGAMKFNGYTAEADLRGTFVGPESSTRIGFLWWQMVQINQDYENACYKNVFKDQDFPWCHRMESIEIRKYGRPAKQVHYEHWANYKVRGTWLLHRGWQYWEYFGAGIGIGDPFLTHMGVMARFGVDLSEVSDFALGWLFIDFKHDDMTHDEYIIYRGRPWGLDLVPARPRRGIDAKIPDCAKAKDEAAPQGSTVIDDASTTPAVTK